MDGVKYEGGWDSSGGRTDAAAGSIGHKDANGRVVIDVVRAWPAPHNPAGVIAEVADLFKAYGCYTIWADSYTGDFPREQFRLHGVTCKPCPWDRSELYLQLLPLVNAKQVQLLDVPELLRELRGLERRRGPSGRDRCDHRPGAHDDRAVAVAVVAATLAHKRRRAEWVML